MSRISLPTQPAFAAAVTSQPKFGAWAPGSPQSFEDLVAQIEDKLDLPVKTEAEIAADKDTELDAFSPDDKAAIKDARESLGKMGQGNFYRLDNLIEMLELFERTGYQPTPEESEKLAYQIKSAGRNLTEAVRHFPRLNEYDRSGNMDPAQLTRMIERWLKTQTNHLEVTKLAKVIERSSVFEAPAELAESFQTYFDGILDKLDDAGERGTYLKSVAHAFRPKSNAVADLTMVISTLVPESTLLVSAEDALAQAVRAIAASNTKLEFAGRTRDGKLYVVTSHTESHAQRIFYGEPGDLKEHTATGGWRAMDGSETSIPCGDDLVFNFKRPGLMGNGETMRGWSATVNDEPVREEFNTHLLKKDARR